MPKYLPPSRFTAQVRSGAPLLLLLLLALLLPLTESVRAAEVFSQEPEPDQVEEEPSEDVARELLREMLASGERIERETRIDETGERVSDGRFRRFSGAGELVEAGRFERGERVGEWRTYHPNGAVESKGAYLDGEPEGRWVYYYQSGERSQQGDYRFGARNLRWNFWFPDGGLVPRKSGSYIAEIEYHPNGRIAMAGEKRGERRQGRWRWWTAQGRLLCEANFDADERHGSWRSYWPRDGSMQLIGAYQAGQRVGAWTFRHLDGSYDARMLSGQYDAGRRIARVGTPASEAGARRRNFGQPLPLSQLPSPSPVPGTTTTDRVRVEALVESFRKFTPSEREERSESLVLRRQETIPAILAALCSLDLRDSEEARFASFLDDILARIHAGHSFGWRSGSNPDAAFHNQNQILRWLSLWELNRAAPAYLNDLAESPVTSLPSDRLLNPPILEPARIVDAAPSYAFRVSSAARARRLHDTGGAGTESTLAAALSWLADAQSEDGSWAPQPAESVYRVALTGLAAFALVGAGHGEPGSRHATELRSAVAWLTEQQAEDGQFGAQFEVLGQALASTAIAEYMLASGDFQLGPIARRGLDRLLAAQQPDGSWRAAEGQPSLEPPVQLAPTEILSTCWAIGALHAGSRAGFEWPLEPARLALGALTRAADPLTGELAGSAGTSAALLARFQLGQLPEDVPLMQLAIERVLHSLRLRSVDPELTGGGGDGETWYFVAHALFQAGGRSWREWSRAQGPALSQLQVQDSDTAEFGSFPPTGFWGEIGGRSASTALFALALESYYRLPREPR